MPTIFREDGFDVTVFTNDHEPPHVHVFKADSELIVNLSPIQIRDNYRMSKRDARKALRIVTSRRDELLDAWDQIHGRH